MSSNTLIRIVSAIVMILLVSIVFWAGAITASLFILLVAVGINDEFLKNFLGFSRKSGSYVVSQLIVLVSFIVLYKFHGVEYAKYFIIIPILFNLYLIYFLFFENFEQQKILKFFKKFPMGTVLLTGFPLLALTQIIFSQANWVQLLIILLMINFSMDTGAWFIGKNLGKTKLWPAISPKKTVEGLIGGIFFSTLGGGISYWIFFHKIELQTLVLFGFLGFLSQVGDLLQSKIKRQCKIKDSSSLIPGHGGLYDRLDSLSFVVPFFAGFVLFYIN